jgi:hypothetical protein
MLMALVAGALGVRAPAQTLEPDTELRVRLLAPLSTETNRKGDKITASVIAPEQFAGGTVEGEVRESKSGRKIRGTSVLNFTFHTLTYDGNTVPIQSQVKAFYNSQGQQNVDEEGRIITRKSNVRKAAAATGVGAVIGAIAGGARGAAIGAGIGGAASLILIQVAAKGAIISFAAGSEFVLSVKPRREAGAR